MKKKPIADESSKNVIVKRDAIVEQIKVNPNKNERSKESILKQEILKEETRTYMNE